MGCTLPQLRVLLEAEELRYYLIPDTPGVMLNVNGDAGRFQFRILSQDDGEFLQFRSDGYLYCTRDNPNLDVTLQVLGDLNYRLRLMKLGWDSTDGEISLFVDHWLMDAEVTQEQFSVMANGFMSVLDDKHAPLHAAIEEGVGLEAPDGDSQGSETIDTL